MKLNKYTYYKVIQQFCGNQWNDVSFYETKSDYISHEKSGKTKVNKYGRTVEISLITHDLAEYSLMGYSLRVIKRKVLNNK